MLTNSEMALVRLAAQNATEGELTGAFTALTTAITALDEALGFLTAGMADKTLDGAVSEVLTNYQLGAVAIRGEVRRAQEGRGK